MQGRQQELGFAAAEASLAERRNTLGLALVRVECDCYLSRFVKWVFNATHGGLEGELKKSYQELAARPWGLCCSVAKARSTVARARHLRLVAVSEKRYVSGGQEANGYAIDWPGVRNLLVVSRRPGALIEHPPALIEHPPALIEHPFKEETFFLTVSLNSGSGPEAEPVREDSSRMTTDAPAGPRMDGRRGMNDRPRMAASDVDSPDALRIELLRDIPELRAVADQRIDPLPANRLVYGAFAALHERHLRQAGALVEWHRRQLSLARPLCGDTAADLVLVLAAAKHAVRVPAAEVTKSRVAIFVSIVSRRKWRKALPHVPAAAAELARLIDAYGVGVLHGVSWPPAEPRGRAAPLEDADQVTRTECNT